MIRSKRMRQDGDVAHMREKINAYVVLVGRLEGMRTILKWSLNTFVERAWSKFIWLRTGTNGSPIFDSVMILEIHQ
jgi:hypothetical protein